MTVTQERTDPRVRVSRPLSLAFAVVILIASMVTLSTPAAATVVCSIDHYPFATFNGSLWMVSGYGEIACSEPVAIIDVYTYLVVSTGDPNSPIVQATQANHCYGYALCAAIAGPLCCYSEVHYMHTKTWGDVTPYGEPLTNLGPTNFNCSQIAAPGGPMAIRIGVDIGVNLAMMGAPGGGDGPLKISCSKRGPAMQGGSA